MSILVRAAALSNFAEVARQVGLDPRALLRQFALEASALGDPDVRVPVAAVAGLLEAAAQASGCQTFGLRMAESRRLSDFGAVSLLITHQPTARDAVETVIRYRSMLNEALVVHLEDSGDLVIIREELVIEEGVPARQSYDLAIGALFRMFSALLGPRWRPHSVNFTHAAPDDLNVHRRMFGPSAQFESEFNGFVCSAADLARPNPSADPALAQYARQYVEGLAGAEHPSMARDVRRAAYMMMPQGRASIGQIAQAMGMNIRTLQRRLDAEGEEFSRLLNGVRRDLAVRYLANPAYSLTEIAQLLGYGQHSSFTRWFISEFETPPSRWRERATDPLAQRPREQT
jgi:AraC-like DNA-binding protein